MLLYLEMMEGPEERSRFEQLYTRYRGLMFHAARNILGSDQDAEDAVHEAFLVLAENMGRVEETDSPRTKVFLLTVTEHKAIDLYRRKAKIPQGEFLEELQGVTVEYQGEDGVTACLLKLPARYRDFLLLKYDQGFTNRELEGILDLSAPAVRKLDQRARDRLEQICKEEGIL